MGRPELHKRRARLDVHLTATAKTRARATAAGGSGH